MKGLVGAEVEPLSFAVISGELADAIRAYQDAVVKVARRRKGLEARLKGAGNAPARELARKNLRCAKRALARAEGALLVAAGKEPIARPTPVVEEPKTIGAFGPYAGVPMALGNRLQRGTPAELRSLLTPR